MGICYWHKGVHCEYGIAWWLDKKKAYAIAANSGPSTTNGENAPRATVQTGRILRDPLFFC